MRRIFSFIVAILTFQISNAQWEWQNPKPQGYHLSSIAFCDNDNGIAVGKYGTLLKTTDGGETWNLLPRLGEESINYVLSPDSSTFTALTSNRAFLSTNLGETWSLGGYSPGLYSGGRIALLTNKVALAYHFYNFQEGSSLFKSTDGALTWQSVFDHEQYFVRDVAFSDTFNGFVVTHDSIYRTHDGLDTWMPVTGLLEQLKPFSMAYAGRGIYYLSAGIYTDNDQITYCKLLKSNDYGDNWTTVADTTVPLSSLYFVDSLQAFGVYSTESSSWVYYTNNGGIAWSLLNHFYELEARIKIVDSNTVFLIAGEKIFKWRVEHAEWELVTKGMDNRFQTMTFLDDSIGYAVSTNSIVLKTTDAGATWTPKPVDTYMYLKSKYSFADANNGIVSSFDTLHVTHDGAETWTNFHEPLTSYLEIIKKIDYVDPATVYLLVFCYEEGYSSYWYKLLCSTDTLHTWKEIELPDGEYYDMQFISPTHGFLTGTSQPYYYGDGFVLKTIDSGQTWFELDREGETGGTFTTIQMFNDNSGVVEYADFIQTKLLPVENGIVRAQPLWVHDDDTYASGNPYSFQFFSHQTGFVLYQDVLYRLQTDSLWGPSWSVVDKFPEFAKLCFSSPTNGFLYQGNMLIHLSPDANPMGIEPVLSSDQPSWIGVAPVPATDRLVFTYTGKVEMAADLTLVNLQGQSVIHSPNVVFAPGIGFSLDVSHVPAGIYLYRFAHENGIITGKVIISR